MNSHIPANDNLHKNLIMGLVVSKTGYQHIELQQHNLTQQDINRMYSCLSKAIQKLRDLEAAIYGRKQ